VTAAALALSLWLHAVPALQIDDAQLRRQVLLEQLHTEQRDTELWYWTWGLGWSAATVVQLATWPVTSRADRPSLVAWGLSSAVGAIVTFVLRPEALGAYRRSLAPNGDVEKEWVAVHDDEVFNHGLWQQLGVVVLNAVPFFVLGLGYKRWDWAYLAIGVVVSEAQIATFPQLLRVIGVR
jgi:hypothetical protein